ncbi:MAG: tetratricopeptide repeat protein [Phycisphaerae bacterium]
MTPPSVGPVRPMKSVAHRAACVVALLTAAAGAAPRNVKIGDPIGRLQASDINNLAVDTDAWRGGPAVWIFVSAEQTSSENALADLQAALDELVGAKVHAVAITTDAVQLPYFRELIARRNLRVPVVLDAARDAYGRIGVIVLPTTLVTDGDGKIAYILAGHDLEYRRAVAADLALLAGRISADEHRRRIATTQPPGAGPADNAARLCRTAELMEARGLTQEAIGELNRAISLDPTCDTAYLQLARIRARSGDLATAEKLIADVLRRNPAQRTAKLELGTVRFMQGKFDDAAALLQESLVLNPDTARTHYWLGRVYAAKGDAAQAAEHFRAAVEKLVPDLAAASSQPARPAK